LLEKLKGKVAIITGAGRGIGRSIALALAAKGAHVVLTARTQPEIDAVAREASRFKVDALAVKADVSQESEVEAVVKKTQSRFNRIDILFNNAGIAGPTGFITDIEAEDWDRTFQVNLKGMFLFSRAVIPQMIGQKGGNIVNVSSGAGKRDKNRSFLSPTRSMVYSVTKFGVEGFTLALAAQVNAYHINVNAIQPGATDTRIHSAASPERRAKMRRAEDIRSIAVFLASQGPLGITGESLNVSAWEKIYLSRDAAQALL